MVRYLKRRIIDPVYYRAQDQKLRILESHRVKRCGVCTFEFPEEDMTVEDGVEKCPMCVDTYTAEYLANEEADVAEVKMASAMALSNPPQFSVLSLDEPQPGAVTAITDSAGSFLSQTAPLRMIRNDDFPYTFLYTVLLIGQRFTSANVTTYPAGIVDNVPPVITPALITLSLRAAGFLTPGAYGITMADGVTQMGHEYPRLLAVR